jgi:hypothetical protein
MEGVIVISEKHSHRGFFAPVDVLQAVMSYDANANATLYWRWSL